MQDVKGHVVEFCKDQAGSRFIQQALDSSETTDKQVRRQFEVPQSYASQYHRLAS